MRNPPERPWLAVLRSLVPRLRLVTVGVRALVRWEDKIVLVRHRFHDRHSWFLPGGGVDGGEDAAAACTREVLEEAGIPLANLVVRGVSGVFLNQLSGWDDHVLVFVIDASAAPCTLPLSLEIAECRAFGWDELPRLSPATERRLRELRERSEGAPRTGRW